MTAVDRAALDAAILAAVAGCPGGAASVRWVEVRVLMTYPTPDALDAAPNHFELVDAVWGLVESGRLAFTSGRRVRLAGKAGAEDPTG